MGIRFNRSLKDNSVDLLTPTGKLNFLINGYESLITDDPFALDIHLRENNEIMLYHGGTRLVTIRIADDSVKFSASSSYKKVGILYDELMKKWSLEELFEKKETYKEYLSKIVNIANSRYYKSGKEGWWANRLSLYYGKNWDEDKEWLIFDREAVLGFESELEKDKFYESKKEQYDGIESKLRESNERQWGRKDLQKSFGDELDFLAIGSQQELLCIELKHGSNTKGIYWGPLQVSVYRDAFEDALKKTDHTISEDIKKLVRQKISLGLLPEKAKNRLPIGNFSEVKSILLIADFNEKSTSWDKMQLVQNELKEEKLEQVPIALVNEDGTALNLKINRT